MSLPEGFDFALITSAIGGTCGGCAKFLHGVQRGYYREDRYRRKFLLEVAGGTMVGFFVSLAFNALTWPTRTFVAFTVGLAWATVCQQLRQRVTAVVTAALGTVKDTDSGTDGGVGKSTT